MALAELGADPGGDQGAVAVGLCPDRGEGSALTTRSSSIGSTIMPKALRRARVLLFFVKLPPCLDP